MSEAGYITCGECKYADHGPDRDGTVWCHLRGLGMYSRWSCGYAERREADQDPEERGEDKG